MDLREGDPARLVPSDLIAYDIQTGDSKVPDRYAICEALGDQIILDDDL